MFGERFLVLAGLKSNEVKKAETTTVVTNNEQAVKEYIRVQSILADMLSDAKKNEFPFKLPDTYRF